MGKNGLSLRGIFLHLALVSVKPVRRPVYILTSRCASLTSGRTVHLVAIVVYVLAITVRCLKNCKIPGLKTNGVKNIHNLYRK